MRSRRVTLAVILVTMVAAAAAGYAAGTRIRSPAQVAADTAPPEPSLISVPVERTEIRNDIITRGTVRFEDPATITVEGVALEGLRPVVTFVPEVGAIVDEGEVLYEISGRPTFVLGGDLPLFRTVRRGDAGEDIAQLQTALARLGFDPGGIDGIYGPDTEAAVVAFYTSRGYEALEPDEVAVDARRQAAAAAADARDQLAAEQEAVDEASAAARVADEALTLAEQRLAAAEAGTHPDTGMPPTPDELAQLRAEVETARADADAATTQLARAERSLAAAERNLAAARTALAAADRELAHPVPETEFVFLPGLPLRVDAVFARRGDVATGEIMRVSGSRLAIDSSVRVEEADLVSVGMPVRIDLEQRGISTTGTISVVDEAPGTHDLDVGRVYLEIVPDEVRAELNNTNVRITIPVQARSSEGAVLAVPAAALSATSSGDTIVTVVADDGSTRTVTVTPGLATAGGLVQVTPVDGDLSDTDWVVVGIQDGS